MNILTDMELAIWNLAEADRHERIAAKLRLEAVGHVSRVHVEMQDAIRRGDAKRQQPGELEDAFRQAVTK